MDTHTDTDSLLCTYMHTRANMHTHMHTCTHAHMHTCTQNTHSLFHTHTAAGRGRVRGHSLMTLHQRHSLEFFRDNPKLEV